MATEYRVVYKRKDRPVEQSFDFGADKRKAVAWLGAMQELETFELTRLETREVSAWKPLEVPRAD